MVQSPLQFKGLGSVFAEFLTTIADSQLLMRGENGQQEAIMTSAFLDSQTHEITVLLVLFAPNVGIATKISISGTFGTSVSMDFEVQHIQTLEGEALVEYSVISALAIIMALVLGLERVTTAWRKLRLHPKYFKEQRGLEYLIFDLFMLVVLPFIYIIVRLGQHISSKDRTFNTVGPKGLMGVPWNSRDIALETKINKFQISLEGFEQQIITEENMKVFYFFTSVIVMCRLIAATKTHPRTAILVDSMINAADDLWHFVLLLAILLAGFVMVAVIQFGGSREEFANGFRAFEVRTSTERVCMLITVGPMKKLCAGQGGRGKREDMC